MNKHIKELLRYAGLAKRFSRKTEEAIPEPPKLIFIVAGTYEQARRYARDNRLDPNGFRYINAAYQFRARRYTQDQVRFIGTWQDRRDWRDIYEAYQDNLICP